MPHVFLKTCGIWRRSVPISSPSIPAFCARAILLSSRHRIHRKALPARRGRCLRSVFETQARPQGPAENGFPLVCKMAGRACEAHMRNGDWPAERRVFRGATAKAVNATLYRKRRRHPRRETGVAGKNHRDGAHRVSLLSYSTRHTMCPGRVQACPKQAGAPSHGRHAPREGLIVSRAFPGKV